MYKTRMLEIYSLASGSKGNSTIIKLDDKIILIDCGCTKTYIKNKLKELDIPINNIDYLFITHTHSDHISAIDLFKDTIKYSPIIHDNKTNIIKHKENIILDNINICPIILSHDCPNTYGYIITYNNEKLIYITDTGYIKEEYINLLSNATYIILEFNHDIEILMNTNRPHFLKERIYSDTGHLNNEQASNICKKIIGNNTKFIWLAHISQQANNETIALNTLKSTIDTSNIQIKCLKQNEVIKWV